MNLTCQVHAFDELNNLASRQLHSILIEGPVGCGKSYLAKQYASMIGTDDFVTVDPNVQSIRDAIDAVYELDSSIVLCIENLDSGVPAASYTLLKFLEEPLSHVYIVVTCRNRYGVPDTILSRCAYVTMSAPTVRDIEDYSKITNFEGYARVNKLSIWKAVRTFSDADMVMQFTPDQIFYYESLKSLISFKDTISNMAWKLTHYEDNSETNLAFVVNCLMQICNSSSIHRHALECIKSLNESKLSVHAVVCKFLMECKYGE